MNDARAKRATPILFTPIVRRKFDAQPACSRTRTASIRQSCARWRSDLHVPLVDSLAITDTLVRRAGPNDSKRLYVWVAPGESAMYPEGRQDDTHLSVVGATAVAESRRDRAQERRRAPTLCGRRRLTRDGLTQRPRSVKRRSRPPAR